MTIKLLLGGSPCTHWSIAQTQNRETTAEGEGWELFKNYLIAKEKFKPDFFLYENNKSAAQPIKDQISHELGVPIMYINSALVSAQNRQRFYAFNWTVEQPEDRGIMLTDILESGALWKEKAYCIDSNYHKCGNASSPFKQSGLRNMVAEPVRIGDIGSNAQAHRVYSSNGKTVSLKACAGGQGGKTGLYLCPVDGKGKEEPLYEVKDGFISIGEKQFPINLSNGHYMIRKLTVLECERAQTLPDHYTEGVSNTQRYKGLGNGWTAEVIIHILNGVLKDVPRNEELIVLSMYDGIGTGRYCLDKMGFTNVTYYAYEIDRYAKSIASKNYPDIIQMGDAFDLRNEDWKIGAGKELRESYQNVA